MGTYGKREALFVACQSKTLAAIFITTLAVLIEKGIVSEEFVRNDILKPLRDSALAGQEAIGPHDLDPDFLAATSISTIADLVESLLFFN